MFVLRSTYEREKARRAALEEGIAYRDRLLHEKAERVRELLEIMVAMKRDGFVAPPPPPDVPSEPALTSEVRAAIDSVAEQGSREHGDATSLARRLIRILPPDRVIQQILDGGERPEIGV